MDFVAGGSLAAALELGQPSQARAARWLRDIALAVHHAHSSEVLRRDLKPANILLDERSQPLVADFGSARRLSEQGHCIESGQGVLSYYMAPEQASGHLAADFELVLHGRRPRHARLERWPGRTLRWVRRHPLLSGLVGCALLLGLVLVLSVLSLLQSEREQEQSAVDTNVRS